MSSKKWYANAYVLIVVFISGAAISIAALVLLLIPQSGEIVRICQRRMAGLKSFSVSANVAWSGTREAKQADGSAATAVREAVSYDGRGWFDRTDPERLKLAQEFDLRVGAEASPLAFAGRLVGVGGTALVNFRELPPRLGVLNFESYANRWLQFDLDRLRRNLDAPLLGAGRVLTLEDHAYLLEQFRATPFLVFESKLKATTINGVATHHYKVKPEPLFLKDFVIQNETIRLGRELTAKESQALDTFFANVTPESGELWIGKRDYFLHRARFRFRFDDGRRCGTLDLTVNFSEFNRPQSVSLPEGEIFDFSPILESLLPGVGAHLPIAKIGSATRVTAGQEPKGLPIEIVNPEEQDADNDGLSDLLERFYVSDPLNPDTDGDGVQDGAEVSQGLNPTGPGGLFDFNIPIRR